MLKNKNTVKLKDLEGKKKSAFVRKAKRFFAMHKKLDAQITKALKKPE